MSLASRLALMGKDDAEVLAVAMAIATAEAEASALRSKELINRLVGSLSNFLELDGVHRLAVIDELRTEITNIKKNADTAFSVKLSLDAAKLVVP